MSRGRGAEADRSRRPDGDVVRQVVAERMGKAMHAGPACNRNGHPSDGEEHGTSILRDGPSTRKATSLNTDRYLAKKRNAAP